MLEKVRQFPYAVPLKLNFARAIPTVRALVHPIFRPPSPLLHKMTEASPLDLSFDAIYDDTPAPIKLAVYVTELYEHYQVNATTRDPSTPPQDPKGVHCPEYTDSQLRSDCHAVAAMLAQATTNRRKDAPHGAS